MKVKDLLQDLESGNRTKEMLNEKSNYSHSINFQSSMIQNLVNQNVGFGLVSQQSLEALQALTTHRMGRGLI